MNIPVYIANVDSTAAAATREPFAAHLVLGALGGVRAHGSDALT